MSKSVFDVQGCRALTLALARLSCSLCNHYGSQNSAAWLSDLWH